MKRIIRVVTVFVGLMLFSATPVLAFDPPDQGVDPATDVIIWHGDGLTITSGSITVDGEVTVDGIDAAITDAADTVSAAVTDTIENESSRFFGLVIVGGLITLALWQRRIFLSIVVSPVAIVYGLEIFNGADYGTGLWTAGLVIAVIGTAMLYEPAVEAVNLIRSKRGN